MNEIVTKLKQAVVPMALGWVLTIWAPVPTSVRGAVGTLVSAVGNGVHAVVNTMRAPDQQTASR